jgi:hypothetical protein
VLKRFKVSYIKGAEQGKRVDVAFDAMLERVFKPLSYKCEERGYSYISGERHLIFWREHDND